jgi:hypothetical protein
MAAFRVSSLCPSGPSRKEGSEPVDESLRLKMRAETMEALSPAQLRGWSAQLTREAQALAGSLPVEEPLDLLDGYARPLCLSLAAMVTGISLNDACGLCEMAQRVSAASAEPYDPALRASAKSANAELRGRFHSGPVLPAGLWIRCALADYGLLVGKCVVRAHTTSEGREIAASTPRIHGAGNSGTATLRWP